MQYDQQKNIPSKRMSLFSSNGNILKGTRGEENCFTMIFQERKISQKKGQ
jgi:hypothetical protein